MSSPFALIVSRRLQPVVCALLLLAAAQLAGAVASASGADAPRQLPARGPLRP